MLQPLRELAAKHVAHHPLAQAWHDRHTCYFLNMIEAYIQAWEQSKTDDRARYLPHYPNIRAGMVWVTEQGQADLAHSYLSTIGFFWLAFGLRHGVSGPFTGRSRLNGRQHCSGLEGTLWTCECIPVWRNVVVTPVAARSVRSFLPSSLIQRRPIKNGAVEGSENRCRPNHLFRATSAPDGSTTPPAAVRRSSPCSRSAA
jgi:hypothetical protein